MRVFLFSSLLVLALTGCKAAWNPTFAPSGYAHHNNDYKTPPGPEAADIGYDYSAEKNTAVIKDWRHAAADLVLRAKANDILPNGPVYLTTDLEPGAFQAAFDAALRDEISAQDIIITGKADDSAAQTLFYSAYDPDEDDQPETLRPYNDEAHHPNKDGDFLPPSKTMRLVFGKIRNGVLVEKIVALHDVPSYGFKPAGYIPLHERPLEKAEEDAQQEDPAYDVYNQ